MSASRPYLAGLAILSVFVMLLSVGAGEVQAQGCVASRMNSTIGATDTQGAGYYLSKGDWQASFGYRGYRSHRHFVGDVEQSAENVDNGTAERAREGTEVINHAHIPEFTLSRGFSDRLNVTANLPVYDFIRRSPWAGSRPTFATESKGIGDLNLMGRFWMLNPHNNPTQNISLGLGVKMPTGNDRAEDDFLISVDPVTGAHNYERRPVDQSIQPGDGGWGIIAEFQAFKAFGKVQTFASGSYMSNPREQNDFLRDPNQNPDSITAHLSIADQFALRAGLGYSVKQFGLSVAARAEGVPSSDLIGGDLGRRRPGYSIAVEPGAAYSWKRSALYMSVPILVYRNRTQAYADKVASEETGEHVQGDAAFADAVFVIGFSQRF